jgi:hypothetical protein
LTLRNHLLRILSVVRLAYTRWTDYQYNHIPFPLIVPFKYG